MSTMARGRQPKKEVEQALRLAETIGWTVTPTAAGHRWGKASCGRGCTESMWSTPRNAGNHANHLLRRIAACPHYKEDR